MWGWVRPLSQFITIWLMVDASKHPTLASILPKDINIRTGRIEPLPKGSYQSGNLYKREE